MKKLTSLLLLITLTITTSAQRISRVYTGFSGTTGVRDNVGLFINSTFDDVPTYFLGYEGYRVKREDKVTMFNYQMEYTTSTVSAACPTCTNQDSSFIRRQFFSASVGLNVAKNIHKDNDFRAYALYGASFTWNTYYTFNRQDFFQGNVVEERRITEWQTDLISLLLHVRGGFGVEAKLNENVNLFIEPSISSVFTIMPDFRPIYSIKVGVSFKR